MISEKANVRMRAALHAIRPGDVPLPAALAETVANGWTESDGGPLHSLEIPRQDELTELLAVSLAYARTCLRAADRPVTALFAISEPFDDAIPVTTHVSLWTTAPGLHDFENNEQPLMLLSTEPADFLYASNDEHEKVMADTAETLERQGLSRVEAVRKVNEFWGQPSRRWALLYGDWIGQRHGEHWAKLITTA
ncbi:hypothetical protein [Lentzea terrae]|uniref:hypothetical protein n=1 Tax=Lentzea terrae TaxID=2200761 RepID=UPI0013008A22|nr:hypothetical protein [Lentzea terrae]